MNMTVLIAKYANKISSLQYSVGSSARIILKVNNRIYATRRDADFRYITSSDICDVTGNLNCLDTVEAAVLQRLKNMNVMILVRTPFVGEYIDAGKPIGACLNDMAQQVGGRVDIVHRNDREMLEALSSSNAVLLKGRYAVICGRTLNEAYMAMLVLEKSAAANVMAKVLGGARRLGKFECRRLRSSYRSSYALPERELDDDIKS